MAGYQQQALVSEARRERALCVRWTGRPGGYGAFGGGGVSVLGLGTEAALL